MATEKEFGIFKVTSGIYALRKGTLRLSKEQADKRPTRLKKLPNKKDLYEVTGIVEFHRGEILGIDEKIAAPAEDVTIRRVPDKAFSATAEGEK